MSDIPDPLVVGICYPSEWWTEPGAFDAAVAELEALGGDNGRVEVLALPYEEEHERRSERGANPEADWAASQPELSAEQVEGFGRMHVILALDIPAGISELAPKLKWVQAFGAGSDQFVSCNLGGRRHLPRQQRREQRNRHRRVRHGPHHRACETLRPDPRSPTGTNMASDVRPGTGGLNDRPDRLRQYLRRHRPASPSVRDASRGLPQFGQAGRHS